MEPLFYQLIYSVIEDKRHLEKVLRLLLATGNASRVAKRNYISGGVVKERCLKAASEGEVITAKKAVEVIRVLVQE